MSDPNEPLDLSAWEAQAPPSDFAERVLARVREEAPAPPTKKPRRRLALAAGAVATLAIAAAIALGVGRTPSHGDAIARERIEVNVGGRARAVLEPGAHVAWNGDDVTQPSGDVFYRVEPGARFVVHTPAGDVEVKGTCFLVKVIDMQKLQKRDMKSGAIGAALSALAFVSVYEGKVAVSHAGQSASLAAGESAETGEGGVKKTSRAEFDAKVAAAQASDDPAALATANQNLVEQVSEYRKRIESISQQKADLERQLQVSEKRLEAAREAGTVGPAKHEFDLSADDWKELAKDGTVKARTPCDREKGWTPSPEKLQKLGLSPQDGDVLKNAYKHSNDRLWATIRPLCAAALGGNTAVADQIGRNTCEHVILDVEEKRDGAAVNEAMHQVGEIRAGLRPMPGPNEPMHPVLRMFLAVTGELGQFENELAQSYGPDEAHRIAYADEMCVGHSTWGARGAPKK